MKVFKFSRNYRLTSQSDFRHTYTQNKKISPSFVIFFSLNQLSHARLGAVVSKKSMRLAHERNYYKRLVRESFRYHKEQLAGLDIIVIVRANAKKMESFDVRDELEKQWKKLINIQTK